MIDEADITHKFKINFFLFGYLLCVCQLEDLDSFCEK